MVLQKPSLMSVDRSISQTRALELTFSREAQVKPPTTDTSAMLSTVRRDIVPIMAAPMAWDPIRAYLSEVMGLYRKL